MIWEARDKSLEMTIGGKKRGENKPGLEGKSNRKIAMTVKCVTALKSEVWRQNNTTQCIQQLNKCVNIFPKNNTIHRTCNSNLQKN